MANRLFASLAATALVAAPFASAPARAENTWACEVLLCASNPGGWMQFAECVPPIRKLISHLALGGGFPTCSAGGVSKADYTKPKNGRPGYVMMTMTDGTRTRYTVPTAAQVAQAEASAQPGAPLGSETLER
ncbi:hypothetical protein [Novosphingobium soli]|jgi:hypothetical protein|uniref:Uncharacterized protein n=1 Tax=Novosphingobium soli TaxID=574956 RepID=A0ABV6D1H1_9SPHN|tara:strand:+ start:2023 stop:2418 length:396 start_codon:yes stop_codon:yes gene_type:complete